jgi:hypothetical protein
MDGPSTKPDLGEKHRVLRAAKRVRRVSFLLVSFSLDKQRKVTRASARNKKLQTEWYVAEGGLRFANPPYVLQLEQKNKIARCDLPA